MKIFEVLIDNNECYEDNRTWSFFYETIEEAEVKYNEKVEGYPFCHTATITLRTLELGTQVREVLKERTEDECKPEYHNDEPEYHNDESEYHNNEPMQMGDIEALARLRDLLAGV